MSFPYSAQNFFYVTGVELSLLNISVIVDMNTKLFKKRSIHTCTFLDINNCKCIMINPVFKSVFDIHVVSKQSTSLFCWYILQQPNELKLHWRFNNYSLLTFGSLNIFFGYDRLKFIELTRFVMCAYVWERRREKETHTASSPMYELYALSLTH